MLYELLAGRRPFESEHVEGLLYAVHREPPPLEPLPESLRALVASLLQPDRERRLGSVEDLLEQLQARTSAEVLAVGRPLAEAVRLRTEAKGAASPAQDHKSLDQGWLPEEHDAFVGRPTALSSSPAPAPCLARGTCVTRSAETSPRSHGVTEPTQRLLCASHSWPLGTLLGVGREFRGLSEAVRAQKLTTGAVEGRTPLHQA